MDTRLPLVSEDRLVFKSRATGLPDDGSIAASLTPFPVEDWEQEEEREDGGEEDGGDGDDQLFWKLDGPERDLVAEAWKLLRTFLSLGV